jgi:hypothetical protein
MKSSLLIISFAAVILAGRYYDPEVGFFVSTDAAEQYWNAYSYTGGNPINAVDPNGLETVYNNEGIDVTNTTWGGEINPGDGMFYTWNQGSNALTALNTPEAPNQLYVTSFFNSLLSTHGDFASTIGKTDLYNLIKTGGDWDFKNKAGHIFNQSNARLDFFYSGSQFRYDDFGNYHFGHVAKMNGWPQRISLIGAGAVQVKNGTARLSYWNTFFDDPQDNAMIKRGYSHGP